MLHSGFFLGRQYCTFARIVRGQKMVDFLDKLTSRRLATPYLCGHSKARVYHLHNASLYDAIKQRDVRFRKRMALGRAFERLMILDHVLTHREFGWLGSEQDKVAHFLTTTSLESTRFKDASSCGAAVLRIVRRRGEHRIWNPA
jgi:hypothetical protein